MNSAAITDPREAHLPQWAQRELKRLRADLDESNRIINETTTCMKDSDTWLRNYAGPDRPLPSGCTVRFVVGEGRWTVEVTARKASNRPGGVLSVTALEGRLSISPVVTNVLEIKVEP